MEDACGILLMYLLGFASLALGLNRLHRLQAPHFREPLGMGRIHELQYELVRSNMVEGSCTSEMKQFNPRLLTTWISPSPLAPSEFADTSQKSRAQHPASF